MKRITLALLVYITVTSLTFAQTQVKPGAQPSPQDDDVVRVTTELVQTDVMVFDKQGKFVDGLQREQFELRVDGKPQPVSLFDRVVAGSEKEEQLVAKKNTTGATPTVASSNSERRGRTVVFFIDDLHLSSNSVQKTRQAILQFVEKEMGANDQVAIASATGQIGFLQQFTDNKAVLRAAVSRLNHRPYTIMDIGATATMTEYSALRVEAGDQDAIQHYATEVLKETNFKVPGAGGLGPPQGGPVQQQQAQQKGFGMTKESAERMVKERANNMMKQSGDVTKGTLFGLESLMRSSAELPGRKLVFLVSDGFFLNDRNTGFGEKLRQITDAAVRSGAVIYTLDARGLVSMTDVSSNRPDPEGRLSRANTGELAASQDALAALAEDTGGRALLNSDAFDSAIAKALDETSNYYLLAWKPTEEEQKRKTYKRIEVSIAGRPELVVKLPKGYLESQANAEMAKADAGKDKKVAATPATGTKEQQAAKSVDADLNTAMRAAAQRRGVPTTASATFIDTPDNGPIITASVQAATAALDYGLDNKEKAAVDIAGVVLNDQGKSVASFKTRLTVAPLDSAKQNDAGVVYNYKTPLAPGLYQLRAAARDQRSGRVGSAAQWIEIPDLKKKQLTLSSLLLLSPVNPAEKKAEPNSNAATAEPEVQFSVDHRFKKSSQLGFWVFIYNSQRAGSASPPDVTAQIELVGSNGQQIVKSPQFKLDTAAMNDLQRIPYGGQYPLNKLPLGRYELNVTITDQVAKSSATQHVSFRVE